MDTVNKNPIITWVDAVTGVQESRPMNEEELANYIAITESYALINFESTTKE
jgi:hypothetical protein